MKRTSGFTLIELLVVIAIIGILATMTITTLNSAKEKAHEASAQSTAQSIASVLVICLDGGSTGSAPSDATAGGGDICSDNTVVSGTWPALPGGWGWTDGTATTYPFAGGTAFGTDFAYFATSAGGAETSGERVISCAISGCSIATI